MHEVSVAEHLLELAEQVAAGERVLCLEVVVGERSCVAPESLRFCFELMAAGTALEGARLDLRVGPGSDLRLAALEVA